jgi:glutathione synthase/RimK-type ligase-like ATP-grasp enzyme
MVIAVKALSSLKPKDQLVDAPLYTRYIKKKEEYRIHVFQGDAFFVQRKARKKEVPDDQVNWKVRNLAGGFIFANQNVEVDDVARNEACNAVAALALDFGAVDIIRGTDGKYYVLEVNTACGLEGTTLEKYVEKFQQFR